MFDSSGIFHHLNLAHFPLGGVAFTLARIGRLFISLMLADFSHQSRFFTGLDETPERLFKRFIISNFDMGHLA